MSVDDSSTAVRPITHRIDFDKKSKCFKSNFGVLLAVCMILLKISGGVYV